MAFLQHITREVTQTVQDTRELLDRQIYVQFNNQDLVCITPEQLDSSTMVYHYMYIKRISSDFKLISSAFLGQELDEMLTSSDPTRKKLARAVTLDQQLHFDHKEIPQYEFLHTLQKALSNLLKLDLSIQDNSTPQPGYQGSH